MLRLTRQYLTDHAPERWLSQYSDGRGKWAITFMKRPAHETYELIKSEADPDKMDAIIGNTCWTHTRCGECGEYKDSGVVFGENYDSFTVCDDCLKEAFFLAFQTQEFKLCDHGFGVGFCGDKSCPNHKDAIRA